ncbi:hypothetical protein LJ739_16130 [Aestuariibacter halophilus]|uniref:Hemerythrin-like domain-containing protein n=1 Tax=Fluctibacter halophilus TaxID=226011 RepID=A0ABS8GB23_9ALTE|nr:hypothetical protein [Aestuariibacter halophilus]MCC2617780.1 hypothetical protein [Aestuariibacter halophilus]
MRNFSDVKALLKHNQQFHAHNAEFYTSLARQVIDERVKMLLSSLVRHEVELSRELEVYLQQAPQSILNTYFQYDHEQNTDDLYRTELAPSHLNSEEVEKLAHRLDDYLCMLYQEMIAAAGNPAVQELFDNLHQHMQLEKRRLTLGMHGMWDC